MDFKDFRKENVCFVPRVYEGSPFCSEAGTERERDRERQRDRERKTELERERRRRGRGKRRRRRGRRTGSKQRARQPD